MEHWPGYDDREKLPIAEEKDKEKQKEHRRREPSFWRWPQLEYGSIGRITLVPKDGRAQWSSVVDTSSETRWSPLGRPAKIFPETRSPQVSVREHSAHQRAQKGLQYLRAYFPDADFPGELLKGTLEIDTRETRRLNEFDPILGNLLEVIPSYPTQNESAAVFPMGELGRELNISQFSLDSSGNMVFLPTGSPSFVFETPILQISSAIMPSEQIVAPYRPLLIRTHASSSLLHLGHSKLTRELDITRSEVGDIPIMDSRILASGSDIVVVNRNGEVYRCNAHLGNGAMQLIGARESNTEDNFWQLGVTGRTDECFLASCKVVKHIDMRSASPFSDVFSLGHQSTIVTSFEPPMHDFTSRITTTSEVIWLDDRFRGRPLLSYKHYRNFDRTLRVLSGNSCSASVSLLTSRRNNLVTLYDIGRGSDGLLHCNSSPSCLPHDGSMFSTFDGHALVALPSNKGLAFLRLCQRGSVYRQDIRIAPLDDNNAGAVDENYVTHQWGEDVKTLAKQSKELRVDFGPAGERHYTEVNLRGAYEEIFAIGCDTQKDKDTSNFEDMVARLPNVWKDPEETVDDMLTTFDVVSSVDAETKRAAQTDFLSGGNFNAKQAFDTLIGSRLPIQELADLARWHYDIQHTSVPAARHIFADHNAFHENLKELNLLSGVKGCEPSVQRETEAREHLVLDLALSNDVYSTRPVARSFAASKAVSNTAAPMEMCYSEEPPEVQFGYFRPVRKAGADHYTHKEEDGEEDPAVSSPLGVRLLLAEWKLGTDPEAYSYRDPYGVADIDAESIPQYRRLPVAPSQKKQTQPQQPPLVIAAATQPPAIQVAERVLPTAQDSDQPVNRLHSQQQREPGLDVFSQELMTSTQVLPGPFGGRPGTGKKPAKKRIGGF